MKTVVVGTGYVGLSNAVLLAQHNEVLAVDLVREKVDMINRGISPIKDKEITEYLAKKLTGELTLTATTDGHAEYGDADVILIATPTNYDEHKNYFDTGSVESVLSDIDRSGSHALVVIKSTIPIGFTARMAKQYPDMDLIFMPEFLREGKALYDNLYPSRIVVGADLNDRKLVVRAERFIAEVKNAAIKKDVPSIVMDYTEAEAVKLFANSYLALRVAYFNELDTFAESRGLNAQNIIDGICLDPRIGTSYNNPSFGYGGYCLPKDTKQLLANYEGVPQNLIRAVVESNKTRKNFITKQTEKRLHNKTDKPDPVVGIYRLTMKTDSDNFRQSSILGIIERLQNDSVHIIIYEPSYKKDDFNGCPIVRSLEDFKRQSDVIIANRYSPDLSDVTEKLYTRDLFKRD